MNFSKEVKKIRKFDENGRLKIMKIWKETTNLGKSGKNY